VSTDVLVTRQVGGLTIQAVQGDITDLPVDAITNAANDHLWMGSGVAGAIKRRGGEGIEREAVALGPIPVGTSVATGAGDLRARYVIHAAVMGQELRTDLATVAITTRSVLDLATAMGLESVAIPLLGTGVGGLDVDQVASSMTSEVVDMAMGSGGALKRVLLVAFDDGSAFALRQAVEALA
jgi:O-acetyl-ADP-ribose deacetylase (regulator of RNase III)